MRITVAIVVALMLGNSAFAQTPAPERTTDPSVGSSETLIEAPQFVERAAVSDAFEIQSSELALERSERDDVRSFAEQMIAAHSASSEALGEAVAATGIEMGIPTELDAIHAEKLETLRGADDFDAQYLGMQYEAHRAAIDMFTSYSENGESDVLKNFAAQTLPVLTMHLEMLPADAKPD
jgi:putative membrane protein